LLDLIGHLIDALAFAPFGLGLLLVGSFLGWSLFGSTGAVCGCIIGLCLGLWLDWTENKTALRLRWPIAIGAIGLLVYAFWR
jgi:hypothetical protein